MAAIYEWIQDIAFYSLLLVLVTHLIPSGEQKKYVRFFMGLVFVLVVFGPVLRLAGQEQDLNRLFLRASYDQELEEFLQEQKRLEKRLEQYTEERIQEAIRQEEQYNETRGSGTEGETAPSEGMLVAPVEIQIR